MWSRDCNYTIGTNLTLRGHGIAVLDGQHSGTTLTVLSLDDSIVTNNTAKSAQPGSIGGGVFDFSAITLLNNSSVSRNTPDNCDPPGTVTGCTG